MMKLLEALREYIDKHFDYEYYTREEDEDGYRQSCVDERKAMEKAWQKVIEVAKEVNL